MLFKNETNFLLHKIFEENPTLSVEMIVHAAPSLIWWWVASMIWAWNWRIQEKSIILQEKKYSDLSRIKFTILESQNDWMNDEIVRFIEK